MSINPTALRIMQALATEELLCRGRKPGDQLPFYRDVAAAALRRYLCAVPVLMSTNDYATYIDTLVLYMCGSTALN